MSDTTAKSVSPIVVLVHGAFTDASSWTGVIERLQSKGLRVAAPADPLRGILIDSAYAASVFQQIPAPVLAVGHSYGGAVITNAATHASNVVGLVYVAAFAPDEGERLAEVGASSKDSMLSSALVPFRYPTGAGSDTARICHQSDQAPRAFASDLPAEQTAAMAATQRPVSELAFTEPSGFPAWKTLPSWTVVATGDKAAGADVIRSMAERASAIITEVDGSHVILISQPQAVTEVIEAAIAQVS